MAITDKETITALDINFSNGGAGHTASITSVIGAKDLAGEDQDNLGSLIGASGGRTTFTNTQINEFMNNFIEVEITRSKDAVGTTISRKYKDITSLLLKSHCFVVRGRDCHPKDMVSVSGVDNASQIIGQSGKQISIPSAGAPTASTIASKSVIIPYYGEVANSPIRSQDQRFPGTFPVKKGASIFIGRIYNEESSVDKNGNKTSLVYQDKEFKPLLSHNDENISDYYKKFPDYSNYNLRFGYTLSDAIAGFAAAGIKVVGLPKTDVEGQVLFDTSGNLDAVLSAIASKYGFYWFIDPFQAGTVRFVNSATVASLKVTDPFSQSSSTQEDYITASLSTSNLTPRIVNAYNSTIEKTNTTFEMDSGGRFTRFYKFDMQSLIDEELADINPNIFKVFYALYLSGRWDDAELFDLIAIILSGLRDELGGNKLDWGDYWQDQDLVPPKNEWLSAKDLGLVDGSEQVDSYSGTVSLKRAKFIQWDLDDAIYSGEDENGESISRWVSPSKLPIYKILGIAYRSITNGIYLSHRFPQYRARRMSFSGVNVDGPHNLSTGTLIEDVSSLQDLATFLKLMKHKDVKLSQIFDADRRIRGEKGTPDEPAYGFIASTTNNSLNTGNYDVGKFNWDFFDGKVYDFDVDLGVSYLVIHEKLSELVLNIAKGSAGLWNQVTKNQDKARSIKVEYRRTKRPVSDSASDASRASEEEESSTQAGLNAIAQLFSEVSERNDIRYYSLKNNGAFGLPLQPVQLDVKNGTISDILALENSTVATLFSNAIAPQSSSRTLAGLRLPNEFKMTISGISVRLGGTGITTTINESTVQMLKPDEQIIIDENKRAIIVNTLTNRFSAAQRNAFKL